MNQSTVFKKKISYIPIDRAFALSHNQALDETQIGTALFADISGFSSLAETLRRLIGDTKGAEFLIFYLNQAFEAIIRPVHRYGGSVVSFSGDAITCWFDSKRYDDLSNAACSALMAAHEMHTILNKLAMIRLPDSSYVQLRMKIALASGTVQRWVLGLPEVQLIDTILGPPIDRLAAAEQLATAGEIIVDQPTFDYVQSYISVTDTRYSDMLDEHVKVVTLAEPCAQASPWVYLTDTSLPEEEISQWLLPVVNSHFASNIHNLTELRGAVALFLRFTPDADKDPIPSYDQVNKFVRWAQRTISDYGGNLLQLTFGDKGSYLYAAFGAPISYENDAFRALSAALLLRTPPSHLAYNVQIGVSTGIMRSGSYGSRNRCTFGVQGDEVNIAARMMKHAGAGDVLVSEFVMQQTTTFFSFKNPQSITIKGQTLPIKVAYLDDRIQQTPETMTMPALTDSSLIGRSKAWFQLYNAIHGYITNHVGGLVYLCGEAGLGKTYLAAAVRKAVEQEFDVLWLSTACDEILNLPLAPYKSLIIRLFHKHMKSPSGASDLDFDLVYDNLIQHINALSELNDEHRQSLLVKLGKNRDMLRSFVTPLTIDSQKIVQQTYNFGVIREEFFWLIRAFSLLQPIVVHLQDSQFLDRESQKLSLQLMENNDVFPISILLTSRYDDDGKIVRLPDVPESLPSETIMLSPLTSPEIRQLIERLLDGPIADSILNDLYEKSAGNPMYIQLLVDHLRDQGHISQRDNVWHFAESYDPTDLPLQIQTQLIAQIDRLGPVSKSIIQTAAVLGYTFDLQVLGIVLDDVSIMDHLAPCESAGIVKQVSDTQYEFTHTLLRSVAYGMLGQERQSELHNATALALKQVYPNDLNYLITIATHYRLAQKLQTKHL